MEQLYFCDSIQMDSTIQRFSGSLDKVAYERKKGLELSITGLKVSLEETNKTRPLTVYERVDILKALIEKATVLGRQRPTERSTAQEFVLERCRAVRVVIPTNAAAGKQTPALSFWLSLGDETRGQLCVFEGTGGDSANPYNYGRASTFTLLQSLVHFARRQQRAGLLDSFIPNEAHDNPNVAIDDQKHPPSLVEQYHNVKPFAYDFVTDPLKLLEKWGCDISSGLDVEILYRIREYGPDATTNWKTITVFGYALSIERVTP
jgi:hypothetical protein